MQFRHSNNQSFRIPLFMTSELSSAFNTKKNKFHAFTVCTMMAFAVGAVLYSYNRPSQQYTMNLLFQDSLKVDCGLANSSRIHAILHHDGQSLLALFYICTIPQTNNTP
jgi:hypothetical protein